MLYKIVQEHSLWDVANGFDVPRGFLQSLFSSSSSFASCLVHFTKVSLVRLAVLPSGGLSVSSSVRTCLSVRSFVHPFVCSSVRLSVCSFVCPFVRYLLWCTIYYIAFYSKILIGVSNILQELPEFYSIKLLLETIVDKLAYTAVLELVPLMQIPGVKKVFIYRILFIFSYLALCRWQYSLFWQFICLQALMKIWNWGLKWFL